MLAINEQMRAIYTTLNIDPRTAGACRRRASGALARRAADAQGGRQVGGTAVAAAR